MQESSSTRPTQPSEASRWILMAVVLCAISMVAVLSLDAIPATILWILGSEEQPNPSTAPFLLGVALVALAWRRSLELRRALLERSRFEERVHELAYRDEVTGLLNRRGLMKRLAAGDPNEQQTLLLLDLDHFKKINDLYGHAAGDVLLQTIAQRIHEATPEGSMCARLGGDEFAVVLASENARIGSASKTAARLVEELNKVISLDTALVQIGASVGLSTVEVGDERTVSLLRRSDLAMYEAKRLGRNRCVWFDAQMERELQKRNILEAEMRTSILAGRFIPYFQPMLELSSGEIGGFEVLARWAHPERGILEPSEFIPLAEATGMISDLSFAVMRTALQEALSWPNHVRIAVNVSPVQFKDPLLSQRIIRLLQETGFPPPRLELEVTESAILNDRDIALATVASLKNFGVRFSLDEFGTAYASLNQIQELPFDRIKIDRKFVSSLLEDRQSNAIVHAIAVLGRNLQLPITAEGVECEETQARLSELGCSHVQGWLYGKAVPAGEASKAFNPDPTACVSDPSTGRARSVVAPLHSQASTSRTNGRQR